MVVSNISIFRQHGNGKSPFLIGDTCFTQMVGGFKDLVYFHLYLGELPILANMFQVGGSTTN